MAPPKTKPQDQDTSAIKIEGTPVSPNRPGLGELEIKRRAKVKALALGYVNSGMTAGEAAQKAYNEVLVQEGKESARSRDIIAGEEEVKNIENTRNRFIRERGEALKLQGIPEAQAQSAAEKEFEESYLQPAQRPYGKIGETGTPEGLLGALPSAAPPKGLPRVAGEKAATLGEALRPQTSLPTTVETQLELSYDKQLVKDEAKRLVDGGMAPGPAAQEAYKKFGPGSPLQKEGTRIAEPARAKPAIAGTGPNWEDFSKKLQDAGTSIEEAGNLTSAAQSAYDVKVEELQKKYTAEGKVTPDNLAEIAFEESIAEINAIPQAIKNKSDYITDYKMQGPNDPLFLAFSQQIKKGEGVPRLTLAQSKYIQEQARLGRKKVEERLRKEYENKPLYSSETEAVEGIRGGGRATSRRELVGADKDQKIAEMAAAEVETPWWSDPKEVERRLAEPEKFVTPGVVQSETAFGTQQETTVGYLLRAGLLVPNAVAGYLFPKLFTGDKETSEAVEELRRKARPEAYKDSPILLNIAEGRGFVGEAAEVSKLTGIDQLPILGSITAGDIYTAGAFGADILDPTLDVMSGLYRGGRTAVDVARAGKLIGLEGVGKIAAKEGAKAAVKGAAKEWGPTNLFFKDKIQPGDVRLLLSDEVAKKVANDVFDSTGARRALPAGAPQIAREVESSLNALDNYLAKTVGEGAPLSKSALTDALSESAARNPYVLRRIAEVEEAVRLRRAGSIAPDVIANSKLTDARKLLNADDAVYKEVQKSLLRQAARKEVFKATGDTALQNGIIAVTKSTYATADVANKILDEVAKSDLMRTFIPKITKEPTRGSKLVAGIGEGRGRQSRIVDGYKIDSATSDSIVNLVRESTRRGAISLPEAEALIDSLKANREFIASTDVRRIIDAQVDFTAQKYKIARAKDIAETSPTVAKEIGTPLQVRDFSNPGLRKFISEYGGNRPPSEPGLLPGQREIVESVVGELGKMDVKLRDDINSLLTDENVRALYGIPPGASLTRKQLIGYLILGPLGKRDPGRTNRILKLAMDNIIRSKTTKADIFDMFKGFKTDEVSDVWSSLKNPRNPFGRSGRGQVEDLISRANGAFMRDPGDYQNIVQNLERDMRGLLADEANLKVDRNSIVEPPKKDVSNERLIASYYASESNRIMQEAIKKVVLEDAGLLNERYNALSRTIKSALPDGSADFADAINNYIRLSTENPRFLQQESSKILDEVIGARIGSSLSAFDEGELLSEISDIAERVMKTNGIKRAEDFTGSVARMVNQAVEGNYMANLQAAVGSNVAEQIVGALQSGGAQALERGLAEALTDDKTIASVASGIWNGLTEAWYTLVLTAAPRFHGANIVGAPEVIYSTTGKVISPLPIPGTSTFDAAMIMKRAGGPQGGKVAVKDRAGRTYTNNEIYKAILEGGGESLNKADIPSIAARAALIQIQEGSTGASRRLLDKVINSPSSEDMMYRMAVALEELRDGRTLESATKLARAALYDKGTITEGEKGLQRAIMFYSFMRNNFVNFMKNLTQPEGWKRILNVAKTKRGVEAIFLQGMTEDEKKYLPETAAQRIVLGKGNDFGEKGNIIATPGLSTFSAIEVFTKLLALDKNYGIDLITSRAVALAKDADGSSVEKIPPEHVFILKNISEIVGADPTTVMSWLAGEKIVPLRSKDPDAVEGLVYPLLSEDARKRYSLAVTALSFIGVNRLINDIPNSVRAPGGKVATALSNDNVGYGLSGLYAAGFLTPLKTLSAESQRLRALANSTKAGKELLKDIDQALTNDALAGAPADTQEMTKQKEQQTQIMKSAKIRAPKTKEQRQMDIRNEIQSLQMKSMMDPSRFDSVYKPKIEALMKEYNAL